MNDSQLSLFDFSEDSPELRDLTKNRTSVNSPRPVKRGLPLQTRSSAKLAGVLGIESAPVQYQFQARGMR